MGSRKFDADPSLDDIRTKNTTKVSATSEIFLFVRLKVRISVLIEDEEKFSVISKTNI